MLILTDSGNSVNLVKLDSIALTTTNDNANEYYYC